MKYGILKYTLFIFLLLSLCLINIFLFKISSDKTSGNRDVEYYKTLLNIIINESIEGYNAEGQKLTDSLAIYSLEGERMLLSQLLNENYFLFFRYNENSCGSCVDFIIPYIQRLSDEVGKEKIIILASYTENRFLKFFKKEKKIQNRFFNLSEKRLGIELDAKDLPYLFIMNNDKIINLAFVPQKAIPLSTERYFELIKSRLRN